MLSDNYYCFALVTFVLGIGFAIANRLTQQPIRVATVDPLDQTVVRWSAADAFSFRNLLTHLLILGRTGAGKTTSSGREIGMAVVKTVAADVRTGGLILAGKSSDVTMWKDIFSAANRSDDLRVFSPSEPLRFNFLDFEMCHGGHTRSITQCIQMIGESLNAGERRNDGDQFWAKQQERKIYNGVEIVKKAQGRISAPDLQRFILTAATSREELKSDEWRKGFHYQCLEAVHDAEKSPIEASDFQLAADYWLGEYPAMAERTRSSILAGVMGILHVFNTGVVKELISGETNISPDDMLNGSWVLVDMTPAEWGSMGTFVCAGWKYLTQRRILRRQVKAGDSLNLIWADEFHQYLNSFDAQYLAQSRSHLGAMVALTQSLSGLNAAFGSEFGKQHVDSLLANFAHTIVHPVDPETATWCVKKLGMRKEHFIGGSMAPTADVYDDLFGNQQITGSISENYASILQETAFMHGMRTGGPANDYACDTIILKSGEPFSTGENWLQRTFFQR